MNNLSTQITPTVTQPLTYAAYVCDECEHEILFHGNRSTNLPGLHWLTHQGKDFVEFEKGKTYKVCGKYKYSHQSDVVIEYLLTNSTVTFVQDLDE